MRGEEARVVVQDAGVGGDAEVDPVAHQVAVVVGRLGGVADLGVALVVAAAGAQVADAAGFAAGAAAVQACLDEFGQARFVDAVVDVAEQRHVGAGKALAQVDATLVIHRQQADAGAAGQQLLVAFVHVGE